MGDGLALGIIDRIIENIGNWFIDGIFNRAITYLLSGISAILNAMFYTVTTEVMVNPDAFGITGSLRALSDNVVVPVAGIFLTFVFVYEIITMISERNNMAEFEVEKLFWTIFRTGLAIILVSSAFTIVLAFIELGGFLVAGTAGLVGGSVEPFPAAVLEATLRSEIGANVGAALVLMLLVLLSTVVALSSFIFVIVVVWTRLIMIMIYATLAPIPFSLLLSTTWASEVGKTFLKNLVALALQSFLIILILAIFSAIWNSTSAFAAHGNIWLMVASIPAISVACSKMIGQSLVISKTIMGTA